MVVSRSLQLYFVFSVALVALITTKASFASVPEYKELQSCYNPGMLVTNLKPIHEACTKKIIKLAKATHNPERLLTFVDIVYNADSAEAAKPILDLALSRARTQSCGSMSLTTYMFDWLNKGDSSFLKRCQPVDPTNLVILMNSTRDPENKKKFCELFKKDLKKHNMYEFCQAKT